MDNLQALIDATPDGETLVLTTGEYQGPVTIHRCIVIEGQKCTIWSKQGPVVSVTATGVSLRSLRIEVTQFTDEVEEIPENTAIHVEKGIDVVLDDVIARGYVIGIEGENGAWLIPPSVELGGFAPRATNSFLLRLFVPVICQISTDITGVTISPSTLKPGLNELEVTVKDVYPDVLLLGRCYLRSTHVKRPIGLTGRAFSDKKTPPVDRRLLWEPSSVPTLPVPIAPQEVQQVVVNPLQPDQIVLASVDTDKSLTDQNTQVVEQSPPPFMPAEDAATTDMPGPIIGISIPNDPVDICSPLMSECKSSEPDDNDTISLSDVISGGQAEANSKSIPVQPQTTSEQPQLQQPEQTRPMAPRKPSVYRPGSDLSPLFTAKSPGGQSVQEKTASDQVTSSADLLPDGQAGGSIEAQSEDQDSTSIHAKKKSAKVVTVPSLFAQPCVQPVIGEQVEATIENIDDINADCISQARSATMPKRRSSSASLPAVFGGSQAADAIDSTDPPPERISGDRHSRLSSSSPSPSTSSKSVAHSQLFGTAFKQVIAGDEESVEPEPSENHKPATKAVASSKPKLGDAFKLPSN